ncbi:hypothetical protein ACLB2K_000536 [Fragaria x ananassa]
MLGLVEGMMFAHKSGLDVSLFLKAISVGAAGSRSLDLHGGRILKRDFEPGFYVKDLGICLKECQNMGLALPGLALAQQLYLSLKAHGGAIWAPKRSLWLWSAPTMCHLMNKLVRQSNKTRVDVSWWVMVLVIVGVRNEGKGVEVLWILSDEEEDSGGEGEGGDRDRYFGLKVGGLEDGDVAGGGEESMKPEILFL